MYKRLIVYVYNYLNKERFVEGIPSNFVIQKTKILVWRRFL